LQDPPVKQDNPYKDKKEKPVEPDLFFIFIEVQLVEILIREYYAQHRNDHDQACKCFIKHEMRIADKENDNISCQEWHNNLGRDQ
jgi:hypothetical protein